jgi:hypothetical protein
MNVSLKSQFSELKQAAKERGLKIAKDKRLKKTPYIAMQPKAAKELNQPYKKKTITHCGQKLRKLVMDVRHEIIEYDKMKRGWKYKAAHKFANRKQNTKDIV